MIYVCEQCDSAGVQVKEWNNINTGQRCGSVGDESLDNIDNNWCPECEEHVIIVEKEE